MKAKIYKEILFIISETAIYFFGVGILYYPNFDISRSDLLLWLTLYPAILIIQYGWRYLRHLRTHGKSKA